MSHSQSCSKSCSVNELYEISFSFFNIFSRFSKWRRIWGWPETEISGTSQSRTEIPDKIFRRRWSRSQRWGRFIVKKIVVWSKEKLVRFSLFTLFTRNLRSLIFVEQKVNQSCGFSLTIYHDLLLLSWLWISKPVS